MSLALGSCSVDTTAPKNWLPSMKGTEREGYGGWITLYKGVWWEDVLADGELIAVSDDSIYVLDAKRRDSLVAVWRGDANYVEMTWYHQPMAAMNGQVLASTLLFPISHGWIGILFWPVWLIVGPIAANAHSNLPSVEFEPDEESHLSLRNYARFPQGLPPEIDRTAIWPKPRPAPAGSVPSK